MSKSQNTSTDMLKKEVEFLKSKIDSYKNIFDTLTEAIYVLNNKWQFIDVNKGAEKMYGLTKKELIGRTPSDVAAPDKNDMVLVVSLLEKTLKDGKSRKFEFTALRKSGKEFTKEVIINKGDHNGSNVIIATARDISDRKKQEEELKIYKSISDQSVHGNAIYDINGKIIYMNKYFASIHGFKISELIGKSASILHTKAQHKSYKKNTEELFNKGNLCSREINHIHKNGSIIPLLTSGILINDVNGKPQFMAITIVDISDLKKARAERDLFFDNSIDMICTATLDGYFKELNPAWEKTLGWTVEDLKNKPFLDYIHPNDIPSTYEAAKKLGEGIPALGFENRYRGKDGTYHWLSWNTIPIPKEDIMLGIARDISNQKKSEQSLIENEEKFRALYDNAPLSYQSLDENGHFIDVNPTWLNTLGYERSEVIGENYADFLHPEWKPHFEKNFPAFKKRGYVKDVQFKLRHKKGHFVDVSFEGCIGYHPDGSFRQTYCVFKDITEQKKAEYKLMESEERFRGIFQHSNIGITIGDKDANFIEVNHEFLKMLGYNINEILQTNAKSITHMDDWQKEIGLLDDLKSGKINNYRLSKRLLKKDKTPLWCDVAVTARKNAIGEIDLLIGMILDIDQSKKYKEELIIAKEKAVESDRLKSAFLANMSHEIRTPMNGILGFTELLEYHDLSFEERLKYVNIIKKSGNRMLNTVNDIIDISKIDAGQMKLEENTFNIKNEIETLVQFFQKEANQKQIFLSCNFASESKLNTIGGDKGKINSILTNLIKNAIKFTENGSITINAKLKNNSFECDVIDTGIGIPKDRIKAIFNRFEQADIEDFHAREGSGLGLAISKSYAEMMNGNITVQSSPGKGSKFKLFVPVTIKRTKPVKHSISTNIQLGKQLNFLIAEDDETSFLHLSILLAPVAKNIIRTTTGESTIEEIRKREEIDCILMDIKMPSLNGYEATRQIRKFNNKVVIIAQTAYAIDGEQEKALIAGCNEYITKPIDKKRLFSILHNHFE